MPRRRRPVEVRGGAWRVLRVRHREEQAGGSDVTAVLDCNATPPDGTRYREHRAIARLLPDFRELLRRMQRAAEDHERYEQRGDDEAAADAFADYCAMRDEVELRRAVRQRARDELLEQVEVETQRYRIIRDWGDLPPDWAERDQEEDDDEDAER